MLRLIGRQQQKCHDKGNRFEDRRNLKISIRNCQFFVSLVVVRIDNGSKGPNYFLHDSLVVFAVINFGELFDNLAQNVEPRAIPVPEIVVGEQLGQ